MFERRLREVVRNAVIDALRRHRMLARLRCGACVHFDKNEPPPGCSLRDLPDLGTEAKPNPWFPALFGAALTSGVVVV